MKKTYFVGMIIWVICGCSSPPVFAQELQEELTKALEAMFPEDVPSEEDLYLSDRLLITATGLQKPVHLAPSVASVITADDIEEMGATTLLEALETVPGIHIGVSPLNAMEPVYSVRGIQTTITPQILILMNGTPITMAFVGTQVTSFRMPVNMISRIEVVRGPGSAVHGADAFSGVINIITKDGLEIEGSHAGIRYGSFDTLNTWIQHGGDYKGWNVALGLDYQKSQGDSDRVLKSDNQATLDSILGTSATLTPGPLKTQYEVIDTHLGLIKDNWTTRIWGWFSDDKGVGDGVTNSLSHGSTSDAYQYMVDLLYQNDDGVTDWQFDVRVNYFAYELDAFLQLFPEGAMLPIAADGNIAHLPSLAAGMALFPNGVYGNPVQIGSQASIDWTTFYQGITHHLWRFSVGYRNQKEEYESWANFGPGVLDDYSGFAVVDGTLTNLTDTKNAYMPETSRDLFYVLLQDEWSPARGWIFTGGVRYDTYSDFGDSITPRLALVWEPRNDLTSKIMYGRAFRIPSFSELYVRNNPANLGNDELSPETIDTYEIAFNYQPLPSLITNLNFFYYETEDLIDQVPVGTIIRAENAKNTTGYGFEIETDWQVSKSLRLKANLARQRSKDQDSNELIANAPGWQFYANAHWYFLQDWSLDGQYYWVGDRHRVQGDTREDVDDYDLVNLTLRRKNIAKRWDAALSLRNLFNKDVREPAPAVIPNDYPMEGRAIWAELQFHFP